MSSLLYLMPGVGLGTQFFQEREINKIKKRVSSLDDSLNNLRIYQKLDTAQKKAKFGAIVQVIAEIALFMLGNLSGPLFCGLLCLSLAQGLRARLEQKKHKHQIIHLPSICRLEFSNLLNKKVSEGEKAGDSLFKEKFLAVDNETLNLIRPYKEQLKKIRNITEDSVKLTKSKDERNKLLGLIDHYEMLRVAIMSLEKIHFQEPVNAEGIRNSWLKEIENPITRKILYAVQILLSLKEENRDCMHNLLL